MVYEKRKVGLYACYLEEMNSSWLKGICGTNINNSSDCSTSVSMFRPYAGTIEPTMNAISCGDINSTSRLYPLLSHLPSPF